MEHVHVRRVSLLLSLLVSVASDGVRAQSNQTFFQASDLAWTGAFTLATYGIAHFDPKVTKFFQQPERQVDQRLRKIATAFTHVQETTLSIAGLLTYGIARLSKADATSEIAIHATEAIVAASLTSQVIRGPLGRARPKDATPKFEDQYEFHWFNGFRNFEYRSFPSIHSSSAFAAATAIIMETRYRSPRSIGYVAPVALLFASGPGYARVYLGQHWTSDVFMGAFVGAFYGARVVQYARHHPDNRVDRFFLGVPKQDGLRIEPLGGGVTVSYGMTF
jgi:membrane-associated phospholipid phosphatase